MSGEEEAREVGKSERQLDLRESLRRLDQRGLLWVIDRPIDKDSQLMALARWPFRGLPPAARRGFLFRNVTGRQADPTGAPGTAGSGGPPPASLAETRKQVYLTPVPTGSC